MCEPVELGTIQIEYINTQAMPADGLTKPLIGLAFQKFVHLLGLQSLPHPLGMSQSGGVLVTDTSHGLY